MSVPVENEEVCLLKVDELGEIVECAEWIKVMKIYLASPISMVDRCFLGLLCLC